MKIGPFHQSFQTVIKFYLNLNHVLQCENFYAQKSYSKGKCIWGLDHHNFADFWKKKVIIWKRKITLYKLVRYFSDILIRMFRCSDDIAGFGQKCKTYWWFCSKWFRNYDFIIVLYSKALWLYSKNFWHSECKKRTWSS